MADFMSKSKKSSIKRPSPDQSVSTFPSASMLIVPAGAALIAILACIAFLPSINGGFILDDDILLTGNNLIQGNDGLYRIWCTTEAQDYWPITNTMFWIEWRVWGMNPTGYHVINLFLHVVEAFLIWLILRKLSVPGAFLAALIFTVHPVNVESVAWIAQLKNLMCMLFVLLSIFCYLQSETQPPPTKNRKYLRAVDYWYFLSLLLFILAILSKGSAVVLPVLLLGIIWWQRGGLIMWDFVGTAPFFAAAVGFTLVNVWFQTHGSGEVLRNADFTMRLLGAGGVVWFYLYKALLPIDLAFVYPQWHVLAGNPLWWLPLSAAIAVTAILWMYRKKWSRPVLFAWGFFGVTLAPVMGFTDVGFMKYSLVADHYLHIALIGVVALASAGFCQWRERTRNNFQKVATIIAIAAVATLTLLTWRQNGIYRNPITLYQAALEKNPEFLMGQSNLGVALFMEGRFEESIEHYKQAIKLKSDYPAAHNNLAIALVKMGRYQEAILHFEQALRFQPDYPRAEYNMGITLGKLGRLQEAIKHYENAIRLKPDFTDVYYNLAKAYADADKSAEAIATAQKGLELAKAQGLTDKARMTEEWLNTYRASLSHLPNSTPARKPASSPP
jgi:protein O-mannosyl-transferase